VGDYRLNLEPSLNGEELMKKLALGAAMAMVAIAASLFIASPASADAGSQCGANRFCVYTNSNGGGAQYFWTDPHGCIPTQGQFNDSITSFSNHTGRALVMFKDGGCSGGAWFVGSAETTNHLEWTTFNDVASSFQIS